MIIKSYEVRKNKSNLFKNNLFLLYGENLGLKKDIKNFIIEKARKTFGDIEITNLYETEIISNEENFYNLIYSGSLFSEKKIIIVHETTDKIISKVNNRLNYLVTGEKPTTKKIKKAKELNIKILNQDQWMKMLNKTS